MTTIPSTLAPPDGHAPLRAADLANHSDSWLRQMELAQMAGMGGTGPRPHAAGAPAQDMPTARPAAALHPVLPRAAGPQSPGTAQGAAMQDDDSDSPADSGQAAPEQPDAARQTALPGVPQPAAVATTDSPAAMAAQVATPAPATAAAAAVTARSPAAVLASMAPDAVRAAQPDGSASQAGEAGGKAAAVDSAAAVAAAMPAPLMRQTAVQPAMPAVGAALPSGSVGAASAAQAAPAAAAVTARAVGAAIPGTARADAAAMPEPPDAMADLASDTPDAPPVPASGGEAQPEAQQPGKRNLHITGAGRDVNVWIRDSELTPAQSVQLAARLAADMAAVGLRLKGTAVNGKPLPGAAEEHSDINDTFAPGPDHGHARITNSEQAHGPR